MKEERALEALVPSNALVSNRVTEKIPNSKSQSKVKMCEKKEKGPQ